MRSEVSLAISLACGVGVAAIAGSGCQRRSDPAPDASTPSTQAASHRIVTLAPALSQMIVDMGHAGELVGKSQYDTSAPADLPVVGNYLEVQIENLLATDPTDILMMPGKEGPPGRLTEVAALHHIRIVAYPYPNNVGDVERILIGDSAQTGVPNLGQAIGDPAAARRVADTMKAQLARLSSLTGVQGPKPRVLMVIGAGPLMASGPGTVLDDVLTHAVGAINAAGAARVSAPTYDRASLLALQPDVVLFLLPDVPPLLPLDDDQRLAELRVSPIPAVVHRRIVLLSDPLLLLPSSNLPRVAAALAKAIYPDLARAIDQAVDQGATLPVAASIH